MVAVAGGNFLQGTPPARAALAGRVRPAAAAGVVRRRDASGRAQAPPVRIDRHPVTVSAFAEFVRATAYVTDAELRGFGMHYEHGWANARAALSAVAPG